MLFRSDTPIEIDYYQHGVSMRQRTATFSTLPSLRVILSVRSCCGLDANIKPQQDLTLRITRLDGSVENVPVRCRIDTPIEIDYYQHGGILPYVLRQLVSRA